jgi:hypothetical protein
VIERIGLTRDKIFVVDDTADQVGSIDAAIDYGDADAAAGEAAGLSRSGIDGLRGDVHSTGHNPVWRNEFHVRIVLQREHVGGLEAINASIHHV